MGHHLAEPDIKLMKSRVSQIFDHFDHFLSLRWFPGRPTRAIPGAAWFLDSDSKRSPPRKVMNHLVERLMEVLKWIWLKNYIIVYIIYYY
jgi:hypothetical protein